MYKAPETHKAMQLFDKIKTFLQSCGGHYATKWGQAGEDEHIIIGIKTGQFIFKPDCYFICWFMVTDEGIDQLKAHIRPLDIVSGERMWVLECGMQSERAELRRKLRKRGRQGIHWHRAGQGLKDFPRQKGATHGR